MSFNYDRIKDPAYFRENRLDARSSHKYYRCNDEVLLDNSSFFYCLNGIWKFNYSANIPLAPKDFFSPGFDCKSWDDIKVPGHIQLQGYDIPQYVNVQWPWDGHEDIEPGEIPENFNPVASYVKHFHVPEQMQGERVFISFQGVESGFALWLNGQYVGYSLDSFTPSEFELTPCLKNGENKLAVQVFKFTAGSWIEDQDFFRFSGIFRDVFLFSVPKLHVCDLKIEPVLSDDFSSAELNLSLIMQGDSRGSVDAKLTYMDCRNSKEETAKIVGVELSGDCDTQTGISITLTVKSPLLWSAEKPNLYKLELRLYDENKALSEIIVSDVGFRKFERDGNIMRINGKRIEFYGTNRHEFSSETGRAMTQEQMEYDVHVMKRHNINALRTSHYPNHPYMYELCDRYGIYVIDEVNLESHGRWDAFFMGEKGVDAALPGDSPAWLDIVIDRVDSLYHRDKNHPCVLIWSLGNESLGGINMLKMAERFRSLDSTRLIHYEGICCDPRYPDTTDIYSQMYTSPSDYDKFLQENTQKPAILCEYMHTMANSGGTMYKYIDLMSKHPHYQGGFIWDFVDQSLLKKDRYGKYFQAYGGDFDDRPHDANFSGNGILYGDRKLSPKLQTVKFNYQAIIANVSKNKVVIANKHLFTSTSDYDCSVILERNGIEIERKPLETDVAPNSQSEYRLPLSVPKIPGEYAITISFSLKADTSWGKCGYEVAFGQHVIKDAQQPGTAKSATKAATIAPLPKVVPGVQSLGVQGEHFSVIFSKLRGGLCSYKYGGREYIKQIPMPNFWRAPVDNDIGNLLPIRSAQWKIASLYASHIPTDKVSSHSVVMANPLVETSDGKVAVTFTYYLPSSPACECDVKYEVSGDGTVLVRMQCQPKGLPPMPAFGMMIKLDADYENLEWYGMGPEENYIDRATGARLGIFRNKVADNMSKYLVPQECGNKIGVRYAKLTDNIGRGIVFTGDEMEFSALPYTPHELENAMHEYELPQVHYTVVRANLRQMGIAGDQSWGALTHDEYLLPTDKKLTFSFSFKGI